jgi:hypothetical protein
VRVIPAAGRRRTVERDAARLTGEGPSMLAVFASGQVFLSMVWFFLFVMWIMLLFRVFADIFRSDMSAGARVGWLLFVIVLPYIGVFSYLIVRGPRMAQREAADFQAREEAQRAYIRSVAGSGAADELEHIVDLRNRGVLDDGEFARLKARIVG